MALLKAPERPHQRIPQCVLIARWTSRSTSNGRQGFGMNLASPGNSGGKELDVTTTSICGNCSFAFAARAAQLILPANFTSVNKKHTDSPMRSKTETAAGQRLFPIAEYHPQSDLRNSCLDIPRAFACSGRQRNRSKANEF
jgi:hypothetical protein